MSLSVASNLMPEFVTAGFISYNAPSLIFLYRCLHAKRFKRFRWGFVFIGSYSRKVP